MIKALAYRPTFCIALYWNVLHLSFKMCNNKTKVSAKKIRLQTKTLSLKNV